MSSLDAAKLWSYSIIEMGWSQAQENKNIWNKFWTVDRHHTLARVGPLNSLDPPNPSRDLQACPSLLGSFSWRLLRDHNPSNLFRWPSSWTTPRGGSLWRLIKSVHCDASAPGSSSSPGSGSSSSSSASGAFQSQDEMWQAAGRGSSKKMQEV